MHWPGADSGCFTCFTLKSDETVKQSSDQAVPRVAIPLRNSGETRATFTLSLRPEPGVDGFAALKALLKTALGTYGLRCMKIGTESEPLKGSIASEPKKGRIEK